MSKKYFSIFSPIIYIMFAVGIFFSTVSLAEASCTWTGSLPTWGGSCNATYSGTISSGSSVTRTNTTPGYTGSITYSCSGTTWTAGSASCNKIPASCSYSGSFSWGGSCSASYSGTVTSGSSVTKSNIAPGYTGSATYSCSDGSWSLTSSSCNSSVSAPTSATIDMSPATVPMYNSFTAYWSGNNTPTKYIVKVDTNEIDMGGVTSWIGSPDSLGLAVGNHNLYVKACNVSGCSPYSLAKVLTVTIPPPTTATININPTSVLTTDVFSASWSGNNSPTSYVVKVDTIENNMGAATSWSGKSVDLSLSVGVHNFYVKACNAGGCSPYSSAKKLTVTTPVPTTATIDLTPASVSQSLNFTASWSGNNIPTSYIVKLDAAENDMGPATSWTGTPDSLGLTVGNHNLYIKACNAYGCSPYSSPKVLTVTTSAVAPTTATINLSPATVSSLDNFNASWSGNNTPTSYKVKINSGSPIDMGAATSWAGTPASLSLGAGIYSIYTQACNAYGCSVWSPAKTLTVTAIAPTTATIDLSPNSVVATNNFSASWSGNNGASTYKIKVDTIENDVGTSTTWTGTPESLSLTIGNHNLYIKACNAYGCSPYSSPKVLTVTTPAPTTSWLSLSETSISTLGTFSASWSGNNSPSTYNLKLDGSILAMDTKTTWTGTPESIGLTVGTHYIYTQACNAYGCSPWGTPSTLNVTASSSSLVVDPVTEAPKIASIAISPSSVSKIGNFTATWSGNNTPTSYVVKLDTKEIDMGVVTSWTGTPDSLGLAEGSYSVSVKACNYYGCSPWSAIVPLKVTNSSVLPPTTSIINVTQFSPYTTVLDNLTATWSGNNTPTTYNVKVNNTVYAMEGFTTWTGTPASFALTAGTHYVYSQACNDGGCSSWSAPVAFTVTSNDVTPTSATITITPGSVSPTDNITATWTGNNNPYRFNVMIDTKVYNAGDYLGSGTWTGTPESLGLSLGLHRVYIQACNSGGCSDWSAPASFTVTNPVVAAPTSASIILSLNNVGISSTFTASWWGNNNTTYYKMKFNSGTPFIISDTAWTGTPVSVGLAAGSYSVYVQACNDLGCSPWSVPAPLTVTGTVSGVPPTTANINIVVSPDYILSPINGFCANWSGDNSPISYAIKVNSTVYIGFNDTDWCGTPSELGLSDGVYAVSVQACNSAGCGPWSSPTKPLTVYPIATAPTISNIDVAPVTANESQVMTVSWSGNNVPTLYNVMVDSTIYNVGKFTNWTGTPESIGLTPGNHKFYSQACNSGGCSGWSTGTGGGYFPTGVIPSPVITFTASPTTVPPNNPSSLTWSVTGATSCNATDGWTGSKSILGGTESTGNLTVPTKFTLTCTGAGGTTSNEVNVNVAVPLPVASYIRICPANATITKGERLDYEGRYWSNINFLPSCTTPSGYSVIPPGDIGLNATDISGSGVATIGYDVGFPRFAVGNNIGTAKINADYLTLTDTANLTVVAVSVPVPVPPTITTLTATPKLVRSGQKSSIKADVTSVEASTCVFKGAELSEVSIPYAAGTVSHSVDTRNLTSSQIVEVQCYLASDNSIKSPVKEVRVDVIGGIQEI